MTSPRVAGYTGEVPALLVLSKEGFNLVNDKGAVPRVTSKPLREGEA